MSPIINRIIKEDFINHVKNRLDKEYSFFGFLFHNCREEERKGVKRYILSDFKKCNKIDLEIITYNTCLAHPDKFYELLCQKKTSNPLRLLFIFEPNSELYSKEEIRKNCYSVDVKAYKEDI